jgi:hypothetical protein
VARLVGEEERPRRGEELRGVGEPLDSHRSIV